MNGTGEASLGTEGLFTLDEDVARAERVSLRRDELKVTLAKFHFLFG